MSRSNLMIGHTLGGRYRIDEIVGQGGMSAVYKAYDPNLKRVVAVKLIHSHLADDPKFLVRFEEEATAVAQLRHPNIVQVYDFNHDDDLYYMVQEFVPGETLQERLRRLNKTGRRMPIQEAIGYVVNICEATDYAHQRGIIHRDIKPANIMLDVHGQAILMDFGIVKIAGGERHTATGAVVGTALYLPPELIRGEVPDARSDLYSLGVTLFEMVSGSPPFEADSAMTLMMMHLNDRIPDLHDLRPEVPESLIAVIQRSLAKDRDERYPSMGAFAADLHRVMDDQPSGIIAAATLVDRGLEPEQSPGQPKSEPASETSAPVVDEPITPTDKPVPVPPPVGVAVKPAAQPAAAPSAGGTIPPGVGGATLAGSAQTPATPPARAAAPPADQPPVQNNLKKFLPWAAGISALLIILVVGGYLIARGLSGGTPQVAAETTPTDTVAALAAAPATDTPEPTITEVPTSTPTSPPTNTPTPTLSPTPTIPVGVPYSRINGITVDESNRYVVEYETFEYTEVLPGMHVHFFFDTVAPEQAGNPGSGPWKLYGGPRPFTGYRPVDRPETAAQMCILVANADHSIQMNTGNCYNLPDIVAATPILDSECFGGPAPDFPNSVTLEAEETYLVRGISMDESWWSVVNPDTPSQSCWLYKDDALVSGDISLLPLAEGEPPLSRVSGDKLIRIQNITIDAQNHYVVNYLTQGFTESLPGTHIHFFFNTVSPDQVGMDGGGNRLMFGGPSPFSGYSTSDRPTQATQLCALVANPNHSVIVDSGNCFDLPGLP